MKSSLSTIIYSVGNNSISWLVSVLSLSSSVDILLEQIESFIAEDAVLLSVFPLKIAGKKVTKDDFKPYTAPQKW